MSLTSMSLCSSQISFKPPRINKATQSFTFPSTLGVNASTHIMNITRSSWMDGSYLMMYTSGCYECYKMFNKTTTQTAPTSYYQTPLGVTTNTAVTYNPSTDGVIIGSPFSSNNLYDTSGNYVGKSSPFYFTTTNYISGGNILTSSGEFIQLKFPFKFIIRKLNLSPYNLSYAPSFVRIVGSNDNLNWYDITSANVSSITYGTNNVVLTPIIDYASNTAEYFHHRIIWEKVKNTGSTAIQMMTVEGLAVI